MSDSLRSLVALGNLNLNGQERGNIEVYRALAQDGVEARFATHAAWGDHHIQPHLDELGLAWSPVPYARHLTRQLGLRGALHTLPQIYKASRAFADIAREFSPTHIHLANPHYALNVLPALRQIGAPVIYRMGDAPTLHHAVYRQLWRRGILSRVDRFVCNSCYVQKTAIDSGVPVEKTTVILSAPPQRALLEGSDLPSDLASKRNGADGFAGRTVIFVGQLSEHKGVGILVEAALRLCAERDDVRVLIAGIPSGDTSFVPNMVDSVLRSGQGNRIRFLGYIQDIPGLLSLGDIHVAPSLWEEPLANTVLEAKNAGLPAVLFPSGGLPELVVEHGLDAWVCADRSSDALAAGLRHYLDMSNVELRAAGDAAWASLAVLGCDEETFRSRWLDVLTETAQDAP